MDVRDDGLAGIVLLIFGVQLVMHYSLRQYGTVADVDGRSSSISSYWR